MKKSFLFGIIVFNLLALLAVGGSVHAFHDSQTGAACPIPVVMGFSCNDPAGSPLGIGHSVASADFVTHLLAIPLASVVIVVLVWYAILKTRRRRAHDRPPLRGASAYSLQEPVGTMRRQFRRWLVLHRGDDDIFRLYGCFALIV